MLDAGAKREDAVVLPSGAGGGDIALYAAPATPSAELIGLAAKVGYRRLPEMTLEARGVHAVAIAPAESPPSAPTPHA